MDNVEVRIPKGMDMNGLTYSNTNPPGIYKMTKLPQHNEILDRLLLTLRKVDFKKLAGLEEDDRQPNSAQYQIITIDIILKEAKRCNWNMCKHQGFIYLYNGAYWKIIEEDGLTDFLGKAALKLGVYQFKARYHKFKDDLLKQFLSESWLPKPEAKSDVILINLQNGTFGITPDGTKLRPFSPTDFLTYQLPFEYNPKSTAPTFMAYLTRVLPDEERQKVLAEYLGYLFVRTSTLKLEKVLFLYGSGANGKSVFYEVVQALLGKDNSTNCTLSDLADEKGYHRATLASKLVNYASELGGSKGGIDVFKKMASGEKMTVRLPYSKPFDITDYAKLIFNANELPKDTEQTNAYFRRFLIIPFDVTIPEAEQDKELHSKIIGRELSGVFNWVLQGLDRLLMQRKFTECRAADDAREKYKLESDSVKLFLSEEEYIPSNSSIIPLKEIYSEYKSYCTDNEYKKCSMREFSKRLHNAGYSKERHNYGYVIYCKNKSSK